MEEEIKETNESGDKEDINKENNEELENNEENKENSNEESSNDEVSELKKKVDKTILGFNVGHNGGCTIIHKNKLISIAEERLNRVKNSDGYVYSVNYCLKELGIELKDVDLFISSTYGAYLPEHFMGAGRASSLRSRTEGG